MVSEMVSEMVSDTRSSGHNHDRPRLLGNAKWYLGFLTSEIMAVKQFVFRPITAFITLCAIVTYSAAAQQQGQPSTAAVNRARITPGDDVIVVVAREPDLSAALIVDERNEIALARLGVINLMTYSPTSLRDTIRQRYNVFLRDPVVTVTVLRRVAVN